MMWSKALAAVVGLTVVAGVIPACGGNSNDPPKEVDTGLPPEKQLGTLTAGEARQACQRLAAVFNERYSQARVTQGICTRLAVGLAGTEGTCNDFVDACADMAAEDPEPQVEAADCADVDAAELQNCELTVADLEACSNDSIEVFDNFLNEYSCKDAGNVDEEDVSLDFNIAQPASCARIESECPDATLPVEMPQ
jgi:hypothetical protein